MYIFFISTKCYIEQTLVLLFKHGYKASSLNPKVYILIRSIWNQYFWYIIGINGDQLHVEFEASSFQSFLGGFETDIVWMLGFLIMCV